MSCGVKTTEAEQRIKTKMTTQYFIFIYFKPLLRLGLPRDSKENGINQNNVHSTASKIHIYPERICFLMTKVNTLTQLDHFRSYMDGKISEHGHMNKTTCLILLWSPLCTSHLFF